MGKQSLKLLGRFIALTSIRHPGMYVNANVVMPAKAGIQTTLEITGLPQSPQRRDKR